MRVRKLNSGENLKYCRFNYLFIPALAKCIVCALHVLQCTLLKAIEKMEKYKYLSIIQSREH